MNTLNNISNYISDDNASCNGLCFGHINDNYNSLKQTCTEYLLNLCGASCHLEFPLKLESDIICIFGILDNDIGRDIRDEMKQWLEEKYDIVMVYQDNPGLLYEYPALIMAQFISIYMNKPVLYIHTKGAWNIYGNGYSQVAVRNLWKHEFNSNYDWYHSIMCNGATDGAVVALPFSPSAKHATTFFNGFVGNTHAWNSVGTIYKLDNRFYYENIFAGAECKLIGHLLNDITPYPHDDYKKLNAYVNNMEFLCKID